MTAAKLDGLSIDVHVAVKESDIRRIAAVFLGSHLREADPYLRSCILRSLAVQASAGGRRGRGSFRDLAGVRGRHAHGGEIHADFIAERFYATYPHYRGHFAWVVTCRPSFGRCWTVGRACA